MSPEFQHLQDVLEERHRIVFDRAWYARDAAGHLAALQAASESIDRAVAKLPRPIDPELDHYLTRASYDKALAHLQQNPSV